MRGSPWPGTFVPVTRVMRCFSDAWVIPGDCLGTGFMPPNSEGPKEYMGTCQKGEDVQPWIGGGTGDTGPHLAHGGSVRDPEGSPSWGARSGR